MKWEGALGGGCDMSEGSGTLKLPLLVWGSAHLDTDTREGVQNPLMWRKGETVTDFEGQQWVMCWCQQVSSGDRTASGLGASCP